MTSTEHTGRATHRARRCVVFFLLACIAVGSVLAGTAIGTEAALTTNSGREEIPAPFAQADDDDDEGTRVINITAPGEDVEYTLTAPGLTPGDNLELANDDDESDAPQEVIRGDTATGVIGNDKYDSYRFTGSIDEVRLESEGIDKIDVRIDGESIDPRSLTGEETETPTTTTTATETPTTTTATTTTTTTTMTATPTTTTVGRELTQSTSTSTASTARTGTTDTDASTTTPPSTGTTAGSGAESGQSGFGIVAFVLIGIVSGLVLAGALVYVVGSDRFG